MLIDWFTIGAQVVNFLILVWLLKRFLYGPVLAAIEARRLKVAAGIADVAMQESKARAAGEELRQRSEAFDRDRAGLMRRAADEAAAEGQGLRESARQDALRLRLTLTQTLATERAELGRQLSTRTQAEVFAVARRALADLAGVSLEERMIDVFIARLAGTRIAARPVDTAIDAVPAQAALVRCAFEPTAESRAKLEAAVREHFGADMAIRFATSPELICGIELTTGGMKLAWSVSSYLSTLAQDVAVLAATALAAAPSVSPVIEQPVHAG